MKKVVALCLFLAMSAGSLFAETAHVAYIVQKGDSFYRVLRSLRGESFHITDVTTVAEANGIENPNLIYPDQIIYVPVEVEFISSGSTNSADVADPAATTLSWPSADLIAEKDNQISLLINSQKESETKLQEAEETIALRDATIETITIERDAALKEASAHAWWKAPIWWVVTIILLVFIGIRELSRPTRKALEGEFAAKLAFEEGRLNTSFTKKEGDMKDRMRVLESQIRELADSGMALRKLHLEPPLFTSDGKVPMVRVIDGLVPCALSTNRLSKFDNFTKSHLLKCGPCRKKLNIEIHEEWYTSSAEEKVALVS